MIKTDKPWGYEELLESNEFYVVKRLFMKQGCRCSLQYHNYKHETIYVLEGELKITIGNNINCLQDVIYTKGQYIAIQNKVIHRMEGNTDCLYLESSTNQLDDIVRIKDDYARI
jgi:mannose-6-phosphate isomerase-like protein (cupin superfamily)